MSDTPILPINAMITVYQRQPANEKLTTTMTIMDIPLFPLNTVLFPGMPLSLHIFEDRYKQMINTCISEKLPFGVVLIQDGTEALGPLATPYSVGCMANITQIVPLPQGRMNLVAVADARFRIVSLDPKSKPYLMATVETLPMEDGDSARVNAYGRKLRADVIRYLDMLAQAGDPQFDEGNLPTDAVALANFAAYLVRVDGANKQHLLEIDNSESFVRAVYHLYQRENALFDIMLKQSQKDENDDLNPFSLN